MQIQVLPLNESCPAEVGDRLLTRRKGLSCLYPQVRNWVPVNTEGVVLTFHHSRGAVPRSGNAPDRLSCAVRRIGDSTDLHIMPEGAAEATLGQWLSWAGVDLDKASNEQHPAVTVDPILLPDEAGAFPTPRLSGVELSVTVQYFNWGLTHGAALSSDYKCVIEVWELQLFAGAPFLASKQAVTVR